jgi:hypothetical protein
MSGEKYLELASVAGVEGIRYLGFLLIFLFLFFGLAFDSKRFRVLHKLPQRRFGSMKANQCRSMQI